MSESHLSSACLHEQHTGWCGPSAVPLPLAAALAFRPRSLLLAHIRSWSTCLRGPHSLRLAAAGLKSSQRLGGG
eukprot:2022547-Rhodomonas_salina.1